MGIFGGSQLAVIALGIVRNKFLAILLGPAGVGLNAIFITTQELIVSACGLSLRTSGVQQLQSAPAADRARTAGVVARVALLLALAGAAATIALSPLLALWSMGTASAWWMFALLAAGVGAAIYLDSDIVQLQAEGAIRPLASVAVVSALAATALAIPLYYIIGMQAVLPVYLAVSVTYALWAHRERRRYCPQPARVGFREAWRSAGPMLRLGVYLTLAAVTGRLSDYAYMLYLTNDASESVLGLYQAGNTLVNTYVGVVFTAIAAEYYPRLSGVARSAMRISAFAGGEFKVAAWVLMPTVAAFIAASELIVRLLYAPSFAPIESYIDIGVCAMVPRAFGYCLGFVVLARGDGRTFVCTEAASAVISLAARAAGFSLLGLDGVGAAFVVQAVVYAIIVFGVYRYRYGLRLSRGIAALCAAATLTGLLCVVLKAALGWWAPAIAAAALLALAYKNIVKK